MYLRCMPAPSQATSRTPSLLQTDTLVAAASALAQFNFNNSNHSPLDWSPSQRAPHESAASPQNTSPVHFNGWAPPVANPFDSKYRLPPPPCPYYPSKDTYPYLSYPLMRLVHHPTPRRGYSGLGLSSPHLPISTSLKHVTPPSTSRLPCTSHASHAPPSSHAPPTSHAPPSHRLSPPR